MLHLAHIAFVVRDYDEALAFCVGQLGGGVWKDLYGNLWDLVKYARG